MTSNEHVTKSDARPLIEATGITKSFGDNQVLRGIDLQVRRGSVTTIIGPSGSGKTTLLRALNALDAPDGGVVRVGDVEIDFGAKPTKAALKQYRAQSAFVFQSHNLFPHKTAIENLAEGPIVVQKRPKNEVYAEARELLERVGLGHKEDSYPSQLSGGQQQRVGIARALALRPKLILFDEPTSALDPELVGEVLKVIKDLASSGWTLVIVTHELQFARQVADQVLFTDGGLVVETGPPDEVIGNPQHERTKRFLDRILNPLG
jgi:L-cystine transport system ATP-binding protein